MNVSSDSEWITVALAEYGALREEILASMQMQHSALTLGTTTVGVLFAAGVTIWDKPLLPGVIFLVLLPVFLSLTMLVWAGEVARMFRASTYLRTVESLVNVRLGPEPALRWESWLTIRQTSGRTAHSLLSPTYVAVWVLFACMYVISVAIGVRAVVPNTAATTIWLIVAAEALWLLVALAVAIPMVISVRGGGASPGTHSSSIASPTV